MYGHRQNTNVSWADAAHSVFHLHTYHTYLQGGDNKKSLSLLPPVIEQRTPYATTQLRSSTCSTIATEVKPWAVYVLTQKGGSRHTYRKIHTHTLFCTNNILIITYYCYLVKYSTKILKVLFKRFVCLLILIDYEEIMK
jgi:hypothetical protein